MVCVHVCDLLFVLKNLGKTTMNIGLINGGIATNIIPDKATAIVSFRVATSIDEVEQQVRKGMLQSIHSSEKNIPPSARFDFTLFVCFVCLLQKTKVVGGRVEVEREQAIEPAHMSTLEGFPIEVVSFATDIPFYRFDGKVNTHTHTHTHTDYPHSLSSSIIISNNISFHEMNDARW